MQPLLDIAGLAVRYRDEDHDVLAVNGLSLTLGRGETYGLVGESGCGKSSVAMAIVRHLGRRGRIAQGSIRFDGVDLSTLREDEMRRLRGSRIAVIYQDPAAALNPTKRIGRQLAEVLVHHAGSSAAAARSPVIAMLRAMRVPDAELVLERYPHQLSGGQQQRVVIAMAFLARPELLILDEPTTALDVTVEREIIELLQEMQRANGTTALFISHNLGLVRRVCGRVGVMYGGQIVEEGSGDVLFGDPRHPYTRGLLACLPSHDSDKRSRRLHAIPGQVARLYAPPGGCTFMMRCAAARAGVCDVAVPELEPVDAAPGRLVRCFRQDVAAAIGRPATEHPATATSAPADAAPILEITALTKRFTLADGSAILANHEVSFDLVAGETVAVVGESGSGKSTLGRIVIGLEVASAGRVLLHGRDIGRLAAHRRDPDQIRSVQMIFQNPDSTLNPAWTVGRILSRAIKRLGGVASRSRRAEEMRRLLALVRLPAEVASMLPAQLSGGQKQRVAIARAFAGRPALVIADEPISSLDTSVKTAILDLLLAAQKADGTTLLFISHDLLVVRYVADRMIVMHAGEIVEIGSTEDIFAPPYHPYTEALLAAMPVVDARVMQRRVVVTGEVPSRIGDRPGCSFASRCARKLAGDVCERETPPMRTMAAGHAIRCHHPPEVLRAVPPVFLPAGAVARASNTTPS